MEDKIRVGIVSYLNTRPLIYGLQRTSIKNSIELIEETPAVLANLLRDEKIDVGLVPVAVIPTLPQHYIIGKHCIAADGPVASVAIFSEVPLEQVTTVLLDYQSRTSVLLAKWLFQYYWKQNVQFVDARDDTYISQIKGTTAGVIIGDRALQNLTRYNYVYDLAAAWKEATGLPFVFAAWISTKKLQDDFIAEFDQANAYGLDRLPDVIQEQQLSYYNLHMYYTQNLKYTLDENMRKGLSLFVTQAKIYLAKEMI